MFLHTIKLKNFRNLDGEYDLSNYINLIIGENGLGKTNFLEAVGYLSFGKSFRTSHEPFVIKNYKKDEKDFDFCRLEGHLINSLGGDVIREVFLKKTINFSGNGCRKTLKIDGNRKSVNNFYDDFFAVIFSPTTINLVINSPSVRRGDLDDFISMYDGEYLNDIIEYRKIIRNRNKLLYKCFEDRSRVSELGFWNKKMYELGSRIIYKRLEVIKQLNPLLLKISKKLYNLDVKKLSIKYITKFKGDGSIKSIYKSLKDKVENNLKKEIYAGSTLYGPQREDFEFMLNSRNLKESGSRGQQRLGAFLYKIVQWNILKRENGVTPVLLLDDLFSELDYKVIDNICKFLENLNSQIIVTSTSIDGITKSLIKKGKRIDI